VNEPSVIAVTGLRTTIGRGLAARLAARGDIRVIGVDRHRPFRLDDRVHFHRLDLTEPTADGSLAEILALERVEAVVHAAFRTDSSPDAEADHELETIGSLHVMHACEATKVRRLVVASSTMLYGARPDNPNFLTESHPLRGHPLAHGIRDRVEMESLLADWCTRVDDTEVTVLRTAWMFGPEHWSQRVRHFALPIVTVPMGYDPLLQLVHEQDAIDAFEVAVLDSHPGVFNVVSRDPLPLSVLLRLAGKRRLPLPEVVLDRIGGHPVAGDPSAAFYDYLRYLFVADGSRGFDAFGEPVYSTREAWISFVSSRRMRRYR
jgi:UDP-glucose 4-epimerase